MKKILFSLFAICTLLCSCVDPVDPVEKPDAPKFLSSEPASGVVDLATDDFALNVKYDANVRFEGVATIEPATAQISYREAHDGICCFDVSGLSYETTYTVTIPAGAVYIYGEKDIAADEVKISFTTASEPVVPHGDGPLQPGKDEAGWENAASCAAAMGPGWCLGNTLDANGSWISGGVENWEKAWGQPITGKALIKMFADAGFKAIRVPVTWNEHMDEDGNVDQAWMDRAQEIVDYVIDCGMYCILNVHHDTGADSDSFKAWLHADEAVYSATKERYRHLWSQIAARFGGYGQKLVFEAFNEMLDSNNWWDNPKNTSSYDVINKYNQDFVEVVRSTGGNNAHRNLILGVYGASTSEKTLKAFVKPTDTIEDQLLVEVHSYGPYNFAMDESASAKLVFDSACENEINSMFERINSCIVEYGLPVVMGEYGATASRDNTEKIKQVQCYISNGRKYNIPCFYWMALSDGADRSVPKWTNEALKTAIINAYK